MDAKRLGCLSIPAFRIQVHRRDEGLEPTAPLLLITRQGQRQVVTAASLEAEAAGVRVGMTLTQAEVACPQVRVREEAPARYAQASQALLAELLALAPLVEAVRLGLYYLGMRGLRWLYQDEAALLKTLLERVRAAGFTATAGAAGTRFSALAAALTAPSGQLKQIKSGDERTFLGGLPLSILPASGDLLERLQLLGITTVGEFAALSPRSVERRYGADGVQLYRLARAEDEDHLNPTTLPAPRQAGALLEDPAWNADGLLFVMAPLVERLLDELAHEGRACDGLDLHFRLEGGGTLDLPILLGSPVTVAKPVLDLMRLKLGRLELRAGVIEVLIEASRVTEPSAPQGDLFRRVGSPSGMAVTLARLTEALGPEAVVVSELVDGYRIDRSFQFQPVQHGAPGLLAAAAGEHPDKTARPRKGQKTGKEEPAPRPAGTPEMEILKPGFRRLEPPRAIEVHQDEDGPCAVITQGRRREVVSRRGPFRYGGGWWEADFERDYHQLTLSDGVELLIFREVSSNRWFVEGIYD